MLILIPLKNKIVDVNTNIMKKNWKNWDIPLNRRGNIRSAATSNEVSKYTLFLILEKENYLERISSINKYFLTENIRKARIILPNKIVYWRKIYGL